MEENDQDKKISIIIQGVSKLNDQTSSVYPISRNNF